ncbi:30S ribosomal protein S8e [Candidatus Woesearchaeota archaeon]|nr:30S ribosomal protein S8e [Candidatus Woesearchaeota archaeon]
MVVTQHRAYKKPTGSRYIAARSKRKYEIGRPPTMTKFEPRKVKTVRTKGGGKKTKTISSDVVNLFDPKTKKYSQAKIKTVSDNAANRHFIRRNIITKGAIVATDKGKARITNRPGQEGTINAVLVE